MGTDAIPPWLNVFDYEISRHVFTKKIEFLYQSELVVLYYLLFVITIELGKNREHLEVVLLECGMNVNCEVDKSNFHF